MPEFVLNAEVRDPAVKRAKYSRKEGRIPGVFYMHGEKNITIDVEPLSLDPLIYTSKTHIIELKLKDGTAKKCILRDVQFDPVSDKPIHFDLQGLRENEKLTIEVPVVLTGGVPQGVKDGGVLQHFIHKLKVSCLPKDIPEKIEINVASLAINHFVHVRDLKISNVTVVETLDSPVAGVMPPHIVKEAEVVAPTEEAAKEPEVIGKGKKVEEGEEGAVEGAPKPEGKTAPKPEAKTATKAEGKEEKKERK
jgi:large subunit ribosomal protein L25